LRVPLLARLLKPISNARLLDQSAADLLMEPL
jgi:hypothetical protein